MDAHRSDKLESLGLSFSPDSCLNGEEKIRKKKGSKAHGGSRYFA